MKLLFYIVKNAKNLNNDFFQKISAYSLTKNLLREVAILANSTLKFDWGYMVLDLIAYVIQWMIGILSMILFQPISKEGGSSYFFCSGHFSCLECL